MAAAADNPIPEIVHVLLDAGADLHARDTHGDTVLLNAAANNGNPAIIATLVTAGARP